MKLLTYGRIKSPTVIRTHRDLTPKDRLDPPFRPIGSPGPPEPSVGGCPYVQPSVKRTPTVCQQLRRRASGSFNKRRTVTASGLLTVPDGFAGSRLVPRCYTVSDRTGASARRVVCAWAACYLLTTAIMSVLARRRAAHSSPYRAALQTLSSDV